MDEVKSHRGRSYGQFCAVARALDVVGDRWTLLVVRELLAGPMRYGELRGSLAGIATNLLADRLRTLEAEGVVERTLGETGVVYGLTPWGSGLREPMEALGRWGAPLLASGRGDDTFQPRWLVLAIPALLQGATAETPVLVGLDVEGFLIRLRVDRTGPHAETGPGPRPTTVLAASAETVVALAAGALSVDQALTAGRVQGDPAPLHAAFGRSRPPADPRGDPRPPGL